MDSINIKSPDHLRFLLNLRCKIGLTIKDKYVAIPNLSIHYTLKKYKKSYRNNKFKISAPTWNEEFE